MNLIIRFAGTVLALFFCITVQAARVPEYAGFQLARLQVTDSKRSVDFYSRLFSNDIRTDEQASYLKLGKSYLSLQQYDSARIHSFGLAVLDYDQAFLQAYLQMQNIAFTPTTGPYGLLINDADSMPLTLRPAADWEQLVANSVPHNAAGSSAPVFRVLAIDELYISVTNMEVDSLFYSRLLGSSGRLQAGALWFKVGSDRLRLNQTPVGQAAGIGYLSLLVSNTDMNLAAEAVFAAGGIIETFLPNGFSFWDPDGIRVLVRNTDML